MCGKTGVKDIPYQLGRTEFTSGKDVGGDEETGPGNKENLLGEMCGLTVG